MEIFERVNKELGTNFKSNCDINWTFISSCKKLSEDFIRGFSGKVDWECISAYQKLSEDFIIEFSDKVSWNYISSCQKLSGDFIREFADEVDWTYISKYQKLSENFIREFADKVDWICISKYQLLPESFISEFKDKLYIQGIEDNWIYKSAEEKKRLVQETGKYECYDDYFVAYKAIRNDRYSLYNFQYKYEPNAEYKSWCDCSDNENSFGLSVGTYDYANWYLSGRNGKIIRCKVKYEDIGRIVHDGEKIRCFKITPIE